MGKGAWIEQAVYILGTFPHTWVYGELGNYFRNSPEERLIKTAVIHVQLEIIHRQEWVEFFLTAVKEQAKNNIKKVK